MREKDVLKINAIADLLEQKATDKTLSDERIREKMGMSVTTFYRWKPKAVAEVARRAEIARSAADAIRTTFAEDSARKGLKNRSDWASFYEREISKLTEQIEGRLVFSFMMGGKVVSSHNGTTFVAPIEIVDRLNSQRRRHIQDLRALTGIDAAKTPYAEDPPDEEEIDHIDSPADPLAVPTTPLQIIPLPRYGVPDNHATGTADQNSTVGKTA